MLNVDYEVILNKYVIITVKNIKAIIKSFISIEMTVDAVPLHWISKHDDNFCTWMDCVYEVLGQERGLCLLPVSVQVTPGLVVPHSGSTGFTCQGISSMSITLLKYVRAKLK